jgi:hypothetical protein
MNYPPPLSLSLSLSLSLTLSLLLFGHSAREILHHADKLPVTAFEGETSPLRDTTAI